MPCEPDAILMAVLDPLKDIHPIGAAVAGGLIVIGVQSALRKIARYRRRHKQLRFLRLIILEHFTKIGSAEPHSDVNGIPELNAISTRGNQFDHFMRQFEAPLEYGVPDLKPKEIAGIQAASAEAKHLYSTATPSDDWSDLVMYANIYRRYQKTKCLRLPTELPWQ